MVSGSNGTKNRSNVRPSGEVGAGTSLQQLLTVIADSQNVTAADVDRRRGQSVTNYAPLASHWSTRSTAWIS